MGERSSHNNSGPEEKIGKRLVAREQIQKILGS